MSREIDEKVVSMQFDNQQFEQNVGKSMGTIEKLKDSLKFKGATKGLENIDAAAKGISMSPLSTAAQAVGMKFSAMQVMAVTALANITNSAVNAGKRIVSAFTIDPIRTGLAEYETQINAVQTILANTQSKGTTLEDVNGALDELNKYADMTIYNFTEMTRNIGTFTAAGVELDTSVKAIKGIANLAAVSGSNSQQASTAMYQLSQALSSGTVKLMDWNSVVNAGMGGQVFQDALKETARVNGVAIDDMIEKNGSFRETLHEGWLTSDVLLQTLEKFTGDLSKEQLKALGYTDEQIKGILELGQTANDAATKVKTFTQLMDTLKEAAQSGWTQTWEILIGDFEEAKKLWTSVSDVFGGIINKSAEARNILLQGWSDGGGREKALESFKNVFKSISSIIKPIKEAFREIFPRTTVEQLLKITDAIHNFTSKLILSEKAQALLKSTFKGLFAVIDIGITIIKEIVGGIVKLLGNVVDLSGGIVGVTGSIGNWISRVRDSVKETGVFALVIDTVVRVLQKLIDKLKIVVSFFAKKIAAPGFQGLLNILSGIWNIIKLIAQKIGSVLSKIGSGLGQALSAGDFDSVFGIINGLLGAGFIMGLKKLVDAISGSFGDITDVVGKVTGILDSVRGSFEAFQENLKAKALKTIAVAIALLAGSILILSMIDPERMSSALTAITMLFAQLLTSLAVFTRIGGMYKKAGSAFIAMAGMAIAIIILAGALKIVSEIDAGKMTKGIVGIAALAAIVVLAAKAMSSASKTVLKGASSLVFFAIAIKILVSAIDDVAAVSWGELGKGLAGIGSLMGIIAIFLNNVSFSSKAISNSIGIVLIASAIKILASAVKDFGQMDTDNLSKGLMSIAVLLAQIAIFTRLTSDSENVISTGLALVLISASLKIFASAIKDISSINSNDIVKSLVTIAASLLIVSLTVTSMPTNMIGIGLGLIALSTSLLILAASIRTLGSMSVGNLLKSVTVLGVTLAILSSSLNAMKSTLSGSAALIFAVAAITALVPPLLVLSLMSWGGLLKGLLGIAGVFATLGISAKILTPALPAIFGLAKAVVLLGVGVMAAGIGMSLLGIGITALALALAGGVTAIISGIKALVKAVILLIPEIITGLAEGISMAIPAIGKAIKDIVLTLINVVVETVPALATGLFKIIVELLDTLAEYTPQIVEKLVLFVVNLINGIAKHIPEIIKAGLNLISSFFTGIVDALGSLNPDGLLKLIFGVGLVTALMLALSSMAALVPGAMVGILGVGAVIAELTLMMAGIGALASLPGLKWLVEKGGDLMGSLGTAIGKFVGGIIGGIGQGITSALPKIGTNLSEFFTNAKPFFEGIKMVDPEVLNSVKALAETVLILTAANIIDGLTSWFTGGSSLTEFAKEIVPFGLAMAEFSGIVSGKINEEAVAAASNAGKAMAEMAKTIPNSGGVVAFFAGENDLGTFASQIVPFGRAMALFSNEIGGKFNPDTVIAAANAGKAMAEMAETIPNSGGVVAFFSGDQNLEEFSKQLIPFGRTMAEFSGIVSGKINEEAVAAASNAGKAMAEMNAALPKTGGLKAFFTGDKDMDKFSEQIVPFGEAMVSFSETVSGKIDKGSVTAAANAGEAMAKLSTLDVNGLSVAIGEVDKLVALTDTINKADFEGMSDFSTSLTKVASEGIDGFIKAFTDSYPKVTQACSDMLSTAFTNLNDSYTEFYDSGKYLVAGFANAISENTFKAEAKARAMAQAAAQAARDELDIHSPSRVFGEIGDYAGIGFINSLDSYENKSYDAGEGIAKSSVKGLSNALLRIKDSFDSDIDTQPTIRPVLDLSDLESGVGAIDRLFGSRQSIGVLNRVETIKSSMADNQNSKDFSILSAIKDLSKKIGNNTSNVYNINGITYDDGSNVSEAISTLVRAARIERRS